MERNLLTAESYTVYTLEMSQARDRTPIILSGDYICILGTNWAGTATIRFNRQDADEIDLRWNTEIYGRFDRIYVTNVSTPGAWVRLFVASGRRRLHRPGIATLYSSNGNEIYSTSPPISAGTTPGSSLGTLAYQYVANHESQQWESEPSNHVRVFVSADPAAGAEIPHTVPANRRWEIQSIFFSLLTSAAAANRVVQLSIDDGANELYRVAPDATIQTANLSCFYNAGPGLSKAGGSANTVTIPLPTPCVLEAGWRIRTITANFQAGDDFSVARIVVREQVV
mgnify:CR=1 FL=1